jgi:hypothetical protein
MRDQAKAGLTKPHPEFPDNPQLTLFRCFDSTEYEEEDSFEQDLSVNMEADIDRGEVALLAKDDWAALQLPGEKRVLDTGGNTGNTGNTRPQLHSHVCCMLPPPHHPHFPCCYHTPVHHTCSCTVAPGPCGARPPLPKKPKIEKTEVEQQRAKVKTRVRQVGDWVLEAQGWPGQLANSPAPQDIITRMAADCKTWADKMQTFVIRGQALVARKPESMDELDVYMADTDTVRSDFFEFVAMMKRLVKPAQKPKSKAKATKGGASA